MVPARVVGALLMVWGTLIAVAGPAAAGVQFGAGPGFPSPVTVGQTGLPASFQISNTSFGPDAVGNVVLDTITMVPSCSNFDPNCAGGTADPGTFAISPTGVGEAGTACAGQTFTITVVNPATGQVQFNPVGPPVTLGPPGSPTATCRIDFTISVLKVPAADSFPATPGVQTNQVGFAHGTNTTTMTQGTGSGSSITTVLPASPAIVTQASPTVPVGSSITDTATLSGGAGPAPGPTGTITFNLFGPNNATCTGPPIFSSTVPVAGNGSYTSTPPFPTTQAGTYRWVASYSGDINNNPAGPTACLDPLEQTVVTQAAPQIVTVASPQVPLGGQIHDTATLSGGFNPTGTITFNLYGPADPTCAAAPVFTSTVPVAGNGNYDSANFTVNAPGTYRWRATYSGDANNLAAGPTACADANEQVTIKANPTIVTVASPSVPVGGQVHDTATLSNGNAPTGTITFNLYGPNNATCTAPPAFTATVPVNGNGPYDSPNFTPTLAGTYRWTASYSGDALNNPAGPTACLDPAEQVVVTPASPAIVTVASPSVPVGGQVHDTATLSGGVNPTGTITFSLFGPNNATCTAPPAFTATVPVNGNGAYDSPNFTTTLAGTYRWVASYSGDANNNPAGPTACADPAEQVVVTRAPPQIVTNASAPVAAGGTLHDTATLSGGVAPTGTITFNLFGPGDTTCATSIFTSTVPVNGNGNYDSGNFTATQAGTYRWVASYSGDANNNPAGPTACTDPAEATVVNRTTPAIVTNASGAVPIGGQIHDTATLSNGVSPTGTITFNLFGPNNATCAGAPAFTATVPVNGNGNYDSPNFTVTQAGTYRWVASYSGDANNNPAGPTACTDPAEAVVVAQNAPTVTTTASVTAGGQITDTATLAGGSSPTGTITFNLYGPNDATCAGAVAFTSTVPVSGNGTYQSANFSPTAPGVYRFRASYSGDANNGPAGPTACSDPAEQVLIKASPTIATAASTGVPEGGAIHDTATLAGGSNPTGTITFNLFGPDNATCAGPPAFSATVPVNGNGTYQSPDFVTQVNGAAGPGTYRWIASYSGDANNNPAGPTACLDPAESSIVNNVAPSIRVEKTANPLSRLQPGGTFDFTVVVTNTSNEPVTITSLVDDVYGNLNGRGTCAIGAVLAPNGGSYTCVFPGDFFGPPGASQTDTVTATAVDNEGTTVTAQDNAIVTITPILPVITVTKSAAPASLPEPGGTFTFTVVVTNTGPNQVTIESLVDDKYGDLNGKGTCSVPQTLAANGGSFTCHFPGNFTGVGGDTQTDTVTASGHDQFGNPVSASANATVAITSVTPSITVQKSVDPASKPEPGGTFTFSVTVTNTSIEDLTITSLVDDVYGDLNGKGTCAVGATLTANGGTYSCTFPGDFTGLAPDSQTDTVTAKAVDTQGREATASDTATVTLTPVPPTITVKKTADPTTKPEPGGNFTFTVVVTNTSVKPLTITSLVDDVYGDLNGRGTCAVGAVLAANGGQYSCSFVGAFTGKGGDSQTDTVTVIAVDQRGNQVTAQAQATVSLTPLPPTITVVKTPDPSSRQAPGGPFTFTVAVTNTSSEPLTITRLIDNVYGDIDGKGTCKTGAVIQPGATYTCSFTGEFRGNAGDRQTDTVTATAVNSRNQAATASAQATVSLTPGPPPPPAGPLPRTGADMQGPTRLAVALVLVGLMMVAATLRSPWRPVLELTGGLSAAAATLRERLRPVRPPARRRRPVQFRRSSWPRGFPNARRRRRY